LASASAEKSSFTEVNCGFSSIEQLQNSHIISRFLVGKKAMGSFGICLG